ncbi:MAG: SMR family transporter [Candidatus Nealsonbacteria bacterium]
MLQYIFILIIPILTASIAQLFFKKGVLKLGSLDFSLANIFSLIPRILQNGWLLGGMVLFGISFLFYLFVLSKYQLNIAYPIIVSAGIIIISSASWFFFKETLSWLQVSGIVLIIFGIFILAIKG